MKIKWTDEEIAKKIGASRAAVTYWRKGDRSIDWNKAKEIEAATGLPWELIKRDAANPYELMQEYREKIKKIKAYIKELEEQNG